MSCFIEVKGVTKQFVGMKALDKVNFSLEKGEVRALLGINGAGKSTLIKVISGIYVKDEGDIYIDGKLVKIEHPQDAIDLGISTVYQDPQMIPSLTGYENIFLGNESRSNFLFSTINRRKLRQQALDLLEKYPLEVDIDKPVYLLPAIEREIIAILRALSRNCRLLILDEPTSILTEKEKYVLFDFVRMLKSQGVSIIYINMALECGIDYTVNAASNDVRQAVSDLLGSVDVVFDTVGSASSQSDALSLTKGRVVNLVANQTKASYKLSQLSGEKSITTTANNRYEDYIMGLGFIENKTINAKKMITHSVTLDQVQKGFDVMLDKKNNAVMKVIVRPSDV